MLYTVVIAVGLIIVTTVVRAWIRMEGLNRFLRNTRTAFVALHVEPQLQSVITR